MNITYGMYLWRTYPVMDLVIDGYRARFSADAIKTTILDKYGAVLVNGGDYPTTPACTHDAPRQWYVARFHAGRTRYPCGAAVPCV